MMMAILVHVEYPTGTAFMPGNYELLFRTESVHIESSNFPPQKTVSDLARIACLD